jgi:hypothetical protein
LIGLKVVLVHQQVKTDAFKMLRDMYKKLRIPALFFIFLLSFTSCVEEDLDGLFGDPVERFTGTWKCVENGDINGNFGPFTVQIVRKSDNSSEVLIKNFNYQGDAESARALIAGNTITIPRQKICDNTIEIIGSGTYRNGEFTMTYKTNDGADEENITARFYR